MYLVVVVALFLAAAPRAMAEPVEGTEPDPRWSPPDRLTSLPECRTWCDAAYVRCWDEGAAALARCRARERTACGEQQQFRDRCGAGANLCRARCEQRFAPH